MDWKYDKSMNDVSKKLDELAKSMDSHHRQSQKDLAEIHISIARLEEKVGFHDKGLSAIGAMVIAAVSATITQVFWKLFHNN